MPGPTHEQTINAALGETLGNLRSSWTVRFEELGALDGGGRADIIIEDASGWPVVIEAERANYASAETDARFRLGKKTNGRPIETAIALVYPDELTWLDGQPLRSAIRSSRDLEYALYTRRPNDQPPERLPEDGWIKGSVLNLAMLVQRATLPAPRIESLAFSFEAGVDLAANELARRHPYGAELADRIATTLGQADDPNGQTRRMAMTVVANALVFHESLAEASFQVPEDPNAPENSPADEDAPRRSIRSVSAFRPSGHFTADELCLEWERILKVNYWPIFWTAKEIVSRMPAQTSHAILDALWRTAQQLVAGGVTRSHDLMGVVFQKLIADRKFLATYYTRPEAAALLAGLALPIHRPPGGSDWADADTLAGVQIGDFACGTGTLLSAAYHRMSLLHELHGGDAEALHAPMMKHGLVGLDVLPMAVHLTAAMLAGSRPATPFDGECLLTMPYGDIYMRSNGNGNGARNGNGKPKEAVTVGSLDLLAPSVQPGLLGHAAAVTSGGREPEEVRDLVSRVGHEKFDLVIMNPPFTRPTNHEASHASVPIPAYAAFETTPREQAAMSETVRDLTRDAPSNDNAGLASHFVELAHRKIRSDGTIALVLPLSALSGASWEAIRSGWRRRFSNITVVTIAGAGSYDASFSASTGMAECLFVASGRADKEPDGGDVRATFVVLNRFPSSSNEASLLADRIVESANSAFTAATSTETNRIFLQLGKSSYGALWRSHLPETGPWPLVGLTDADLASTAASLSHGQLIQVGAPAAPMLHIPIAKIGEIASRGPIDRDINGSEYDGTPRGPFYKIQPAISSYPTYPVMWSHAAKRERRLVVEPDAEGEIKRGMSGRAAQIWATATRAHYNRDLRFNSQSLIVAMTERRCLGGRAWPSIIFDDPDHEYAFALWCNSTLGLLTHWWAANKTQSGRGSITVTGIPNVPTLDTRALTAEQHSAAKSAFEAMSELRFLPFDQIDEDPSRAELDRRLLVDVLGLPPALCEPGGPLELLRRKLASEPQIHGGKRSRVVFHETLDNNGAITFRERSAPRQDR